MREREEREKKSDREEDTSGAAAMTSTRRRARQTSLVGFYQQTTSATSSPASTVSTRRSPIKVARSRTSAIRLGFEDDVLANGEGEKAKWTVVSSSSSSSSSSGNGAHEHEQSLEPALANLLEEYWGEYAKELDASESKRNRQGGASVSTSSRTTRGKKSEGNATNNKSSSGRSSRSSRSLKQLHENDALRFLEVVSKLCETRKVALPHEIVEKVLEIVENHSKHKHVKLLSHEAFVLARRIHAQYPPIKLSKNPGSESKEDEEGDPLLVVVNERAWTPLCFDRSASSNVMVEEKEEADVNRGGITRGRNRAVAWQYYTSKVEKLLLVFDQHVHGKGGKDRFASCAGTLLSLKHLTNILADDLDVRLRVSRHALPEEHEGKGGRDQTGGPTSGGMSLRVRNFLHGSILNRLISLTHRNCDGGNNIISLKTLVNKLVQLKLHAIRGLRGEALAGSDLDLELVPDLCREIHLVCGKILNLLCSFFTEMERCTHYGTYGGGYGLDQSDRKDLNSWLADLFFNCKVMESSKDRNDLLQTFDSPAYKLKFVVELFASYLGKNQEVQTVDMMLEYITKHPSKSIVQLEKIDHVVLLVVHAFHAKLQSNAETTTTGANGSGRTSPRQRLLDSFVSVIKSVQGASKGTSEFGNVFLFSKFSLVQLAVCHGILSQHKT